MQAVLQKGFKCDVLITETNNARNSEMTSGGPASSQYAAVKFNEKLTFSI